MCETTARCLDEFYDSFLIKKPLLPFSAKSIHCLKFVHKIVLFFFFVKQHKKLNMLERRADQQQTSCSQFNMKIGKEATTKKKPNQLLRQLQQVKSPSLNVWAASPLCQKKKTLKYSYFLLFFSNGFVGSKSFW
jgi:hypothetical protein